MRVLAFALFIAAHVAAAAVSDKPETPFKLATFETDGKTRVGLVFGSRIVDIAAANAYLIQKAHVSSMRLPNEMRALIEQYDTVGPRLYQIANFTKGETQGLGVCLRHRQSFDQSSDQVSVEPAQSRRELQGACGRHGRRSRTRRRASRGWPGRV